MIHDAIYDILKNDSAVAALVVERIYPTLIPLDTDLPAISFNQISEFPINALTNDTDILKTRFQFDCIANTFDQAKAIGSAVIAVLQRYSGTAATIVVIDIEYNNRVDFQEPTSDQFRDTLDFIITYRG